MSELYLEHHGIMGMHWGVRRYQNLDGSLTPAGRERYNAGGQETLFVSGSSKTQDKSSPYYRKKLPKDIRKELDNSMRNEDKIIVGDAPGIDRQVQDYLNKKKYWNVEVYSPGKENRYNANKNGWKVNQVDSDYEPGSSEWLAEKDKAMSDRATKGLAVTLDYGSKATKKNVERLIDSMKDVTVYEIGYRKNQDGFSETYKEKYKAYKNNEILLDKYGHMESPKTKIGKNHYDITSWTDRATPNEFKNDIKNLQSKMNDEELDKVHNTVSSEIVKESKAFKFGEFSEKEIKENLRLYGIEYHGKNNFTFNYEHDDYSKASPYGDHSIDVSVWIDDKGRIRVNPLYSVNG